ncbi:MAG: NAD(P)H-flavin reductase/ferredoxin [Cellvibrionaceae bacterium]
MRARGDFVANITYDKSQVEINEPETVLEGLERCGFKIPFSCRAGICHSCLMQANLQPPFSSQIGLSDNQKAQNLFLACSCIPKTAMSVNLIGNTSKINGIIKNKKFVNGQVLILSIEVDCRWYPGQAVDVWYDDYEARPYSIASRHDHNKTIELHIKKHDQGLVSLWLHNEVSIGQAICLSKPSGNCFYSDSQQDKALLMVGTGTGLAPLYGIIQEAIHQQHQAPIYIYIAASKKADLYYVDQLNSLCKSHHNIHYIPTVRHGDTHKDDQNIHSCNVAGNIVLADIISLESIDYGGEIVNLIKKNHPNLKDWKVFLSGNPDMVKKAQRDCFFLGAGVGDIYADAFVVQQKPLKKKII